MEILAALWLAAAGDVPGELLPGGLAGTGEDPGEEIAGIEVFAIFTDFDDGLKIEEAWGLGADLKLGLGGPARTWLRLGYAGWNTENDEDELPSEGVWVRQYRAGLGFEVTLRERIDVGFSIDAGVYRFRRDGEDDTSPYLEFLGSLGFRPIPNVKVGLLAMSAHTQSGFNRQHTHLFHNYSAGPSLEIRF